MFKSNSDNLLFERFLAYWIFTYGIMRLCTNYSFIVSGSYYLEALFFANELFNHQSVYIDKSLFVILSSLFMGYICSFY